MTDHTAPKVMYCAPSEEGGWAIAHAGDWPSPGNPKDTKYLRDDLLERAVQTALEMAVATAKHVNGGSMSGPARAIRAIRVEDVMKKMEKSDE